MLLQEFVRGMRGLTRPEVEAILADGMLCQALWNNRSLSPWEAEGLLSDANLDRHRHDHAAFATSSPYISTSAGTYREGDATTRYNQPLFALETALCFAVLAEQTDGWVFYGYHFILGRPSGGTPSSPRRCATSISTPSGPRSAARGGSPRRCGSHRGGYARPSFTHHWRHGLSTIQPTDPEVLLAVRACLRSEAAGAASRDLPPDLPMARALVRLMQALDPGANG